jgi:hypothetical protein
MNTDQSVIDIKFEDVLARDLKSVLGKTLDELVKDLVKSSKDALGVSGSLTNLGIIPTKEGTIGGVRFAVDSARRNDVQRAMRDLLGKYAERAGVGKVASVLSNTDVQAFSEPFIRLPNNDPAFAKSVLDYIEGAGGEVLWSENFKDYIALRARVPHSHLAGNKLSTMQQLNQYSREAGNIITDNMKAAKLAADAEAIRKKDAGYISETDLAEQEERRRQLGIVTDEDATSAEKQEVKSFLNSTTLSLGALVVTTKKILNAVLKLLDKELQQSYTAAAMNMDINDLASLEKGVEAMTGRTGVATAAARGVFSAFGPTRVNSEAARAVALASGSKALEDVINNMTLGERRTTEALRAILEGAYANYKAGRNIYGEGFVGREKAYTDIGDELRALGMEDMFGAYASYMDNVPGAYNFDTFLQYRRIRKAAEGAAAGRKISQMSTWKDVQAANAVNDVTDFGPATKDIVENPKTDLRERLLFGLGAFSGSDNRIRKAFDALSSGLMIPDIDDVMGALKDRLKSIKGIDTGQAAQERELIPQLLRLLEQYDKNFITGMISPESIAAGTNMAALSGGTNYFDYSSVTNTTPGTAQGNGTFTIRLVTEKEDTVFPGVNIDSDNFVVVRG